MRWTLPPKTASLYQSGDENQPLKLTPEAAAGQPYEKIVPLKETENDS